MVINHKKNKAYHRRITEKMKHSLSKKLLFGEENFYH